MTTVSTDLQRMNRTPDQPKAAAVQATERREKGLWTFLTWSFFLSQAIAADQALAASARAAQDGDESSRADHGASDAFRAAPAVFAPSASADSQEPGTKAPPQALAAAPATTPLHLPEPSAFGGARDAHHSDGGAASQHASTAFWSPGSGAAQVAHVGPQPSGPMPGGGTQPGGDPPHLPGPIGGIVDPILDPIHDIVHPILDPIVDIVHGVVPPVIGGVVQPVVAIVEGVLDGVVEPVIGAVTSVVHGVVEPILGAVTNVVDGVVEPVLGAVTNVVEGVVEPVLGAVTNVVEGVVAPVVDLIGDVVQDVVGIVEPIVDQVVAPVLGTVGDVAGAVADVVQPVVDTTVAPAMDAVGDIVGAVTDTLQPVVDSFAAPAVVGDLMAPVAGAAGGVAETAGGVLSEATAPVGDLLNAAAGAAEGEPVEDLAAETLGTALESAASVTETLGSAVQDAGALAGAAQSIVADPLGELLGLGSDSSTAILVSAGVSSGQSLDFGAQVVLADYEIFSSGSYTDYGLTLQAEQAGPTNVTAGASLGTPADLDALTIATGANDPETSSATSNLPILSSVVEDTGLRGMFDGLGL